MKYLLPVAVLLFSACSGNLTDAPASASAVLEPIPTFTATTPVPRPDEWWTARNTAVNEAVRSRPPEIVFIGDSITQGWEHAGAAVWARHYSERDAINMGFSGDRTQHVIWRLQNGHLEGISPRLAVVMIGTNNSGDDPSEETAEGVRAIVQELLTALPDTRVLLLAVFPRGTDATDAMRIVNDGVNERIADLAAHDRVEFLDIGGGFVEPNGMLRTSLMPDLLHLSEEGYEIWAESIDAQVSAALDG